MVNLESIYENMIIIYSNNSKPVSSQEIADIMNKSKGYVSKRISELVKREKVKKVFLGYYIPIT